MSFAVLASKMKNRSVVVAADFRGHGSHDCENESEIPVDVLAQDMISLLQYTMQRFPGRSIILVGHGMGAAIAIKSTEIIENLQDLSELKKALLGLIVIDVTESAASEALPFME